MPHEGSVVLDIGTGDGRFVYRSARRNPDKFDIGIVANIRPLIPLLQWPQIESSWARKLNQSPARVLVYLRAVARELSSPR